MRTILTALLMAVAGPAMGQQYFMSVTNQSCGPLKLTLVGDVPCDAISTGCRFTMGKNQGAQKSTTYVAGFETAAIFGGRVRAEAQRRGLGHPREHLIKHTVTEHLPEFLGTFLARQLERAEIQ